MDQSAESQHVQHLQTISTLENGGDTKPMNDEQKIISTTGNFENMPYLFMGLDTSTFGRSSLLVKNPFFKIMTFALDSTVSWSDRTQAVRYMQRIPHVDREVNVIKAAISILSDHQYPLPSRYHFFSNNERIIKLDYDIVNACHRYYYENYESFKSPLVYKILSAQYMLTQFPHGTYDVDGVQAFLIGICTDVDMQINYRAECADILDRAGYIGAKEIGTKTISELGQLYSDNRTSTIYTNLQNVHDTTVTGAIIDTLRMIISSTTTTANSEEVYNVIIGRCDKSRVSVVTESFQRILIDTARYEGHSMCDIMMLVWQRICDSSHRDEMELRMIDELYEMNQTCSTGHLSRLLNILSGFFNGITPIKISYSEQLRSNVFARYTVALRTLSQYMQDEIISEMTQEYKPQITDFIFSYSPRDELFSEFVDDGYMISSDFESEYTLAEQRYFGISV